MTAPDLIQSNSDQENEQPMSGPSAQVGEDLGSFLGTIAKLLHETVAKFEHTSSRITEIIVSQPGKTDRDLILALQDFDRLQQEFSALGEALARTGESAATGRWAEGSGEDHAKHEVIGAISIADLKDRILTHLNGPALVPDVEDMREDVADPEALYEQNDTPDGSTTDEF